jgi:hypothetical protein
MSDRVIDGDDSSGTDITVPRIPPAADWPVRRVVLWLLLGAAVGVVTVIAAMRHRYQDPTPTLTPELFQAAHARWKSIAPLNYNIEIRVTGSQPALYRVEVRSGDAQAAWRNGQPLTTRRTFGTWSVPGMFGTISRDIEAMERHAAGRADRFTPRLTLRAEFDRQYSYPKRYRRIEHWSTVEVAWEVTEFRVLDRAD